MEHIILIGHGSPKKDANNIDLVGKLLHSKIHAGCGDDCVKAAYLQFADPDIMGAITECVRGGAERIILHPYFLYSGMHVTKDIPAVIREAEAMYPGVEFIYTEPLGVHEKLVQIVMERIEKSMNGKSSFSGPPFAERPSKEKQHPIEKRSFEIISEEIDLSDVPPERLPLIKRVIHSTADFEFKKTLLFHPDAIRVGIDAIRSGKDILTDIEMVRAGINKRLLRRWGGKVICRISDEEVVRISGETGKTRAEAAMEKGITENVGIIAIGNAPTALLKVVEMINNTHHPSPVAHHNVLVIGVPVGFVEAIESKTVLAMQKVPFITNLSRKGGTPVAVAIVNALLIMAQGGDLGQAE
jgi:precorrin-8X/cobalt-precorrin-8 methylmutase